MILRFPFVLLIALGVVSILSGVMKLHPDVAALVRNYKDVTHPIWDNSFGLILQVFGHRLSATAKDYLIVGTILLVVAFAVKTAQHLWPRQATVHSGEQPQPEYFFIPMFSEVVVWTLIIISLSETLTYVKPV